MSRKADNAAYASVRMLAVSNAKILRVGGAHGLIFLMWQGCEYINIKGSTDKFGTTILTHLFRPHFGGKSSTEPHSASGFPPCSDKKSTPIWQTSFYQCFLKNKHEHEKQY